MLADARRAGSARSSPSGTTPGSTSWTTCTGSTDGRRSPGSASATAGATSIVASRRGRSAARHDRRLRRDRRAAVSTIARARSISGLARRSTERYLFRAPLDGSAKPRRLTPKEQPGTHAYQISPDGRWAIHTYSTLHDPPIDGTGRACPTTRSSRTLVDNAALKAKLDALRPTPTEFFRVESATAWSSTAGHQAAGIRPIEALSDPDPRLRRAGRPDGARPLGRAEPPVASHARPAGYIVASVDNRGTPRLGVGPGGRASTVRSASSPRRTRPTPAGDGAKLAVHRSRRASASGAGAAAGR